jgi:hypothetical protein
MKSISEFPNYTQMEDLNSVVANQISASSKIKIPEDRDICEEDIKKEKNKIKARESRKRKKDYISQLEDRIAILEVENLKLMRQLNEKNEKDTKQSLGSENPTYDQVKAFDEKFLEAWKNGVGG